MKRRSIFECLTLGLVGACVFVSCSQEHDDTGGAEIAVPQGKYDPNMKLFVIENEEANAGNSSYMGDAEYNERDRRINEQLNGYAINLMIEYSSDTENLVVSPLSASLLHSMMVNLVDDGGRNVFQDAMELNDFSKEDINAYSQKVISQNKEYQQGDDGNDYDIENNVWIQEKDSVYQSFLNTASQYDVAVSGVDFKGDANQQISNTVKSQLGGSDVVIDKADIESVTSVVTSSIRLRKSWVDSLSIENTFSVFENADGSTSRCRMLRSYRIGKYADFSNFNIMELPYRDGDFSMYIVLPHSSDLLKASLVELKNLGLSAVIDEMADTLIRLRMPKFEYQGTMEFNPKGGQVAARFREMYRKKLTKVSPKGVTFSNVYQFCKIGIDETGIVASSETRDSAIALACEGAYLESQYRGDGALTYAINPALDKEMWLMLINEVDVVWLTVPQWIDFDVTYSFAIIVRDNKRGTIPFACCIRRVENDSSWDPNAPDYKAVSDSILIGGILIGGVED